MKKVCNICKEFTDVFHTIPAPLANGGIERYHCESCRVWLLNFIPMAENPKWFQNIISAVHSLYVAKGLLKPEDLIVIEK